MSDALRTPGGSKRMGRNRWLVRLGILAVAGLLWFLWTQQDKPPELLTVQNHSGQPIARLQVNVAGRTDTFRDVATGTEKTASFAVKNADPFAVDGELKDGTVIRGHGKAGDRISHLIILPGGQISFRQVGKS